MTVKGTVSVVLALCALLAFGCASGSGFSMASGGGGGSGNLLVRSEIVADAETREEAITQMISRFRPGVASIADASRIRVLDDDGEMTSLQEAFGDSVLRGMPKDRTARVAIVVYPTDVLKPSAGFSVTTIVSDAAFGDPVLVADDVFDVWADDATELFEAGLVITLLREAGPVRHTVLDDDPDGPHILVRAPDRHDAIVHAQSVVRTLVARAASREDG